MASEPALTPVGHVGKGARSEAMSSRVPIDRSKILKPTRAAAAAADAVAARCETSHDLWESLASNGVIPLDWIGAQRLFGAWCRVCAGSGLRNLNPCVRCGGLRFWGEGVPEIPLALRLAADVPGVLAVEALATEFVARLVRHGARQRVEQVRWRLAGAIVEVSSRKWSPLYGNPNERLTSSDRGCPCSRRSPTTSVRPRASRRDAPSCPTPSIPCSRSTNTGTASMRPCSKDRC